MLGDMEGGLAYAVEDDRRIVMSMSVDKRENSLIYKFTVSRLIQKAAALAGMVKKRS